MSYKTTKVRQKYVKLIKSGVVVDCELCLERIVNTGNTGRKMLTVDHIIPKFLGGTDAEINLQPAHKKCNSKRGHNIYVPRCVLFILCYVTLRELMSALIRNTFLVHTDTGDPERITVYALSNV